MDVGPNRLRRSMEGGWFGGGERQRFGVRNKGNRGSDVALKKKRNSEKDPLGGGGLSAWYSGRKKKMGASAPAVKGKSPWVTVPA